jgi:hypothetical protein
MALFSFRHSVKTFSVKCETANRAAKTGQTAAHLRYITRSAAAREVVRERLGHTTDIEVANSAERLAAQRKGRVCERFIIALPIEASDAQRLALARRFSEELTKGIAGYIFAIHDKSGNDKENPHFHLVAFDIHKSKGGRGRPSSVIGFARKNAVQNAAKSWAKIHNEMMGAWGFGEGSIISSLSFADQGIDRIAQIHEGPASRKMKQRGAKIVEKPEWNWIDGGRTRSEANDLIQEINQVKTETKNAKTHRLGGTDSGHPCQSDRSCSSFGKNGRRGFPYELTTGWSNQSALGDWQEPEDDRRPPWLHRSCSEKLSSGSERHTAPPRVTPPNPLKMGSLDRRNSRSRVRRIFLELILLRDTLQSRLATLKGRRQGLPSSRVANEPNKRTINRKRTSQER